MNTNEESKGSTFEELEAEYRRIRAKADETVRDLNAGRELRIWQKLKARFKRTQPMEATTPPDTTTPTPSPAPAERRCYLHDEITPCRKCAESYAKHVRAPDPLSQIIAEGLLDTLIRQIRGFAHCNCPPDDDGVVRYHSNCTRRLKPLVDDLERHLKTLLEAAQERQWRPIETAPKDGTSIILAAALPNSVGEGVWDRKAEGWRDLLTDELVLPTHWTPLPDAPKT